LKLVLFLSFLFLEVYLGVVSSVLALLVLCVIVASWVIYIYFDYVAELVFDVNLLNTRSSNPHTKTPIPVKPSKLGLIGVWYKDNLYLGNNTIGNEIPQPTNINSWMRNIRMRERKREREREREREWCCRSYIYSVHRWIVLISDYVVPSNLLSTLTERICYPINEVRDIDLAIFLLFCIFSSGTMEKWWSCSIVNGLS
jgi:hypothetical protein